jgi:malate dehydrogenase (oxaloacetate-decarboxylating)
LPQFFTAAAHAVADYISDADLEKGILMPSVTDLQEITLHVALAVGATAFREKVAQPCVFSIYQHEHKMDRFTRLIEKMRWQPQYLPLVPM